MVEPVEQKAKIERRQSRAFVLGSLTAGHGVTHVQEHGFPYVVTAIAEAMGLSTFQVASLHSIRTAGSGVVHIGGGLMVDIMKSRWGIILTSCMVWAALSYTWVGASPNLTVLLVAVVFVSVPGALWHLPAAAALSQRFPDRRGFAISMHGFGASVGSALGPLLVALLLSVFWWRNVLFLYSGVFVVMAFFVWWALRAVGRHGEESQVRALGTQIRDTWKVVKNPVILALVLSATIRGVGLNALAHWTPFYLKEELGMGTLETGLHLTALTGMGIISTPVLGALSDRLGRKPILVPGFATVSVLSLLVVSAGGTVWLLPLLAGMGLFTYSLHQIQQAAVLDLVGRGTEASAIGLIFGLNGLVGIGSPFLASLVIDHLGGYGSVFYYVGILAAFPALIILFTPLQHPRPRPAPGT